MSAATDTTAPITQGQEAAEPNMAINKPQPARFAQSLIPPAGGTGDSAGESTGTGSQSFEFLDKDSYMSRVPGTGMTNQRALQVLAQIESKLAGKSCWIVSHAK